MRLACYPGPFRRDVLGECLAEEKGRLEVDGKVPVPVGLGGVVPFAGLKNGGAVDQDVHLAKVGHGAFDNGRGLARLAEVSLNRQGVAAHGLDLGHGLLGRAGR